MFTSSTTGDDGAPMLIVPGTEPPPPAPPLGGSPAFNPRYNDTLWRNPQAISTPAPNGQYEYPAPPPGSPGSTDMPQLTTGFYAPSHRQQVAHSGSAIKQTKLPVSQNVYSDNVSDDQEANALRTENTAAELNAAEFSQGDSVNIDTSVRPAALVGCNGYEFCDLSFAFLLQTVVQIHIVLACICGIPGPYYGPSEAAICSHYYYVNRGKDIVTSVPYIVIVSLSSVLYLVESVWSPFRRYLSNLRTRRGTYSFLTQLANTKANLWWHIQCYHYETRTRTVTDKNGHTRTETYTVRVDTHSASGSYSYGSFRNIGVPPILAADKAVRVRLEKAYCFADDATKRDYEASFASWVAANDRDTHKDVSSGMDIDGFESYVLALASDERTHGGSMSCQTCWYRPSLYWLSVLTCWNALYRFGVIWSSSAMSYTFCKEVKM